MFYIISDEIPQSLIPIWVTFICDIEIRYMFDARQRKTFMQLLHQTERKKTVSTLEVMCSGE